MQERIPKSPPVINPLEKDVVRPLWSVIIPSYNSINYLRDTINSVLIQAPSCEEMQFEVIDDCSTDGDVEALVKELGKGRITFYRHPENIGHYRNFEFSINRARGRLIHILHGDDIVKPGFYQEISVLFEKYPGIGAAFTHCTYFDEIGLPTGDGTPQILDRPGIIDDFLLKLAKEQLLQFSSMVVKRSVYEDLGTFYGELYVEDWLMWIRIAAKYKVAYSPESLTHYRIHTNNITGSTFINGQNIKGGRFLIDTIQEYLPKEKRKSLKNKAKQLFASDVVRLVSRIYHKENNPKVALLQARRIFNFYPNEETFYCLVKTSIKVLIRYKGKHDNF